MLLSFCCRTQKCARTRVLFSALAVLLLTSIVVPPDAVCQTYTTTFEGPENPLSEGGKWSNNGLDWTNIRKGHGVAYSTESGTGAGKFKYNDSYAILSGYPPDQEAWGQAYIAKPNSSCNQELEILLRFTSAPHVTTGYECFARCMDDRSSYVEIVRWDGPLGQFTYLARMHGPEYGLKNGDVLKASVIGNVITVYINGVKKAQAVDDTFKTGNPGIGEFLTCANGHGLGTNADFGFTRFTANAIEKSTAGGGPAWPLKVSKNKRYLVDQNEVPFLIAGDSPQALVSSLSEAQAETYFANRQAHGFNSMGWMNVASAPPCYPASHDDASTYDGIRPFKAYLSGGTDYAHYDLTKPNSAYFARLDRMIRLAEKHGLAVFLDPMETINWLPTLRSNGLAACTAYGKYLGSRYKSFPNIVWLHGNDFDSWKNNPGDTQLVQALAKGIKSEDHEHLQTVELLMDPSSKDPTWRPIISINLAYTYAATYVQMLECYNTAPAMPAFLGEAHYDLEQVGSPTDYGTPSVLRRQAYWTMLCGGTGQFYGNAFTWTFKPGWEKNLDTRGAAQFTDWKTFFAALPWHELVPDQRHVVVTAGLGTKGDQSTRVSQSDYLTAARTPDGGFVIAYMPMARTITVNMASLRSPAKAQWFDPTSGVYTRIPGSPLANGESRQFTPPAKNHDGDSDWVLVLDASGSQAGGAAGRASDSQTSQNQ